MLTKDEIEWIIEEMKKIPGVILENVQNPTKTDLSSIRNMCGQITDEESDKDGLWSWDENGDSVRIKERDEDYDSYRMCMAEDILFKLSI